MEAISEGNYLHTESTFDKKLPQPLNDMSKYYSRSMA
jgi:hypothetical protein